MYEWRVRLKEYRVALKKVIAREPRPAGIETLVILEPAVFDCFHVGRFKLILKAYKNP